MNRSDKTRAFLMIILSAVIIIFATTLFFTYKSRSIMKKNSITKDFTLTDSTSNYLLSLLPFLGSSDVFYEENIYSRKKTIVTEVDKPTLYEMAMNTLNSIPDEEDSEGKYSWMCFERDLFDKKIHEMYNITAETVSRPGLNELNTNKKIYPMENKVCITQNSEGINPGNIITSVYKSNKEKDNLVIYVYALFEDCIKENSECDGWNVYSDPKLNNKIDEFLFDDKTNNDEIMNNHVKEASKYKIVFKPLDSNGNTKYYWYSIERLK